MAKKVKLSVMTRGQLVSVAKQLGLVPKKRHSDDEIRAMIEEARAKSKSGGKGADVWPAEWPVDMRESFYLTIVREPMPKDPAAAYARLTEVIETLAPHQSPRMLADGEPDCFALDYDPDGVNLDFCHHNCMEMPLCRAICKERRGLNLPGARDIEARAEATEELAAMSEADQAEIVAALSHARVVEQVVAAESKKATKPEAKKVAKVVKKASRAESNQVYVFVGKVKPYLDPEVLEDTAYWDVYRWMKRRKAEGFTLAELTEQLVPVLKNRREAEESARETIKYLVGEGDVTKQ